MVTVTELPRKKFKLPVSIALIKIINYNYQVKKKKLLTQNSYLITITLKIIMKIIMVQVKKDIIFHLIY